MADIFAGPAPHERECVSQQTTMDRLLVIVLSDVAPPHNIHLIDPDGKPLGSVQRLTLVLRAEGPTIGLSESVMIAVDRPAELTEVLKTHVCELQAMTSEEFTRRHGCRSSIPH
jgi:hypothetical protein